MLYNLTVTILLISTFTLIGCLSKSPVGPAEGSERSDPTTPPDLELSQPEIDFFANQSPDNNPEDTTAYELASELVSSEFNPFVQSIYVYLPFLEEANQSEPESKAGGWEWNYNHTHEGQNYEVRMTAEKEDEDYDFTAWTLYVSTASNQENPLDNYKLMELSTAYYGEGSINGSWYIYPLGEGSQSNDEPFLILDWTIYSGGEEYYLNFDPRTSDSNEATHGYYSQYDSNGEEFNNFIQMYIENADFEEKVFDIVWSSNTNVGLLNLESYTEEGNLSIRRCWDENLNDTEC